MALTEQDKDEIRHIIQEEMRPFMSRVEPYLQGVAGLGLLWKGIIAIGGLVLIWAQIRNGLWGGN